MRQLMPWTGMTSLRKEMDRLLEHFGEPRWPEVTELGEWVPSLDLSETKDAVVVKLETPGMDPKDIQLQLHDGALTVKGEKKQEKEEKDERYHRVERSYGAFARSVRLPSAVDASKVTADYKNGVLTVKLPFREEAKPRTINVEIAA